MLGRRHRQRAIQVQITIGGVFRALAAACRQRAQQHVEHRREEQAEQRHTQHPREHGHAHGMAHFRTGAGRYHQGHDAHDESDRRHQDRAQTQAAGLDGGFHDGALEMVSLW